MVATYSSGNDIRFLARYVSPVPLEHGVLPTRARRQPHLLANVFARLCRKVATPARTSGLYSVGSVSTAVRCDDAGSSLQRWLSEGRSAGVVWDVFGLTTAFRVLLSCPGGARLSWFGRAAA